MKKLFLLLIAIVWISIAGNAQVGINTDGSQPDPSAGLDVKFSNKGLLPPRMTHTQLNAISGPADGLIVYCMDCGSNGSGTLTLFMAGTWYSISANCMNPIAPSSSTHVPSQNQVVWNWNAVANATGYKWNTTNNFATAIDMGANITKTETGLNCITSYSRYIWAYSACGTSVVTTLTQATTGEVVTAPLAGTHVPSLTQIVWKWNAVTGATGYKWNTINDYGSATDMGPSLLIMESGLICNITYNRYVWAYNNCGNSSATTLSQSTLSTAITAPTTGVHIPSPTQIVWSWNPVSGATGYKWNTTNNFATATDMGTSTAKTETGLSCNTQYSRFVWAYNACGISTATSLLQSTTGSAVTAPVSGTHVPSPTQIIWNWNVVSGAIGYKWNTTNNYTTALDMGSATTTTENALTCNTSYTRYIWAYNVCGNSIVTTLIQSASGCNTPPEPPTQGIHLSSLNQIIWNWNPSSGATGYKWNSTPDYLSATNTGTNTSTIETGLVCNTPYTRYVWAYNTYGNSTMTTMAQTTSSLAPAAPVAGIHLPLPTQIVWKWNVVSTATGYKWNTSNDYGTAINMGTNTSTTETGLICNTPYTRYVWAYGPCGTSSVTTLDQTTATVSSPLTGTQVAASNSIVWNWNVVPNATGYKWNTINNYATAIEMGTSTSKTETGLSCGSNYTRYVWAYNSCGISIVTTLTKSTIVCCGPTITDMRDGQIYNTLFINNQCWFAQNLNVGTKILGSLEQTNNGIIEKYCNSDNDANCSIYGGLYQWNEMMQYTTTEGAQGICPTGWHLPTDAEWTVLTNFLGGESIAGGKMKESGIVHWNAPNTGATNESGFTALPGGTRGSPGSFNSIGGDAHFWSSSQEYLTHSFERYLIFNNASAYRVTDASKSCGLSARCIRDY